MRKLGSLSAALLCSQAAFAQPAPEQVTVTATRLPRAVEEIPAAVSVVSRDDVQLARQQVGLDESLAQVPGLFMQDRYNFAQDLRISIRGFGARANFGIRGVRIFVDGIPETLPDGQGQVDSIDLGSVERIIVLRGSSSALYGNAAGGVVLVESEAPPERTTVNARLSVGELGFSKHQLKVGGQAGKLGYLVNASDMEMEGFRDHSRGESRSLNGTLRYAIDDDSGLKVALNYTDQPVSDDPGALNLEESQGTPRNAAPAALLFDGGESLEQTRVGFVYDRSFGEGRTLTARNYYVWRTFENLLAFQSGGAVTIDRFFAGGGLQYAGRGTLAGRDHRVIVGIDVDSQDDRRRRYDNDFGSIGSLTFDQSEEVWNTGVFIQDEIAVTDAFTVTAGLRHDSVKLDVEDSFLANGDDSGDRTLRETSPMLGVVYRLAPAAHLYANVGTSFETPTTTELANPAGGGFNAALDPQLATNREVGVKGALGARGNYTLALFDTRVEDELVPFELPGAPGRSFFRNAGESSRKGLELGLASEPVEGLALSIAYTYSDFAFEDFVDDAGNDYGGNRIPGLPRNVVHGAVSWRHGSGVFAGLDALHVDDRFLDNANTVSDDAYTLANLRLGYGRDLGAWRWSAFAGANNLLDEEYNANTRINAGFGRYYEPAPRRNVYGGVEVRWVL
jgi:iron complex outermembrane receptor protein